MTWPSPYDSHPVRQAVPVHAEISGFGTNLSVDGVVAEGRNEAVLTIAVPEAKLWWPVGYGDQPLYDVDVTAGDAKEAFWNGHVGFIMAALTAILGVVLGIWLMRSHKIGRAHV